MEAKVIQVEREIVEQFVCKQHYSHRMSIFWCGFALVENSRVEGVCLFGQPSPSIQKYAFKDRDFKMLELTRLVVQTKTKNAASFLVANALNQLEKPCAVVSFADTEYHHVGIIYQATNWIYTGATVSHDHMYLIDGEKRHSMSLRDKGITNPKTWAKANGIQTFSPLPKHRYFYLCGDKRQKKTMLSKLTYPIIKEYPKSDKVNYDTGEEIVCFMSFV